MSNFNTWKSNTVLIIMIVATSLTEVITLRQAEVLVNESAFINCFSKAVKRIQWHRTPYRKQSSDYVYAGGRFYSPYNTGRFRVDNDLTANVFTLAITNVMHEDAGLYECKDDVLSGVFGSTYLTVLDSRPVCTSNINSNGFRGPNTCRPKIEQENMAFSCAVSFSGNSPTLMWSTLNGNQSLNSPICERKDNRINCSLSMKADPSFDGSTFICQTTTSNDARHNCSIKDIRVEYVIGDYKAAEKRVGDNVTCLVASNLQVHYNWTIQQNNQDNISNTNRTIYLQKPGLYKCSVKYNFRNVSCNASIIAVIVSNIVDVNVSTEQNSERPCYALKNCSRGYCIIISNFYFLQLEPRSCATTEIEALKKLFERLEFKVDVRMNLTADGMTKCLMEYRDGDHSGSDAFVCCLLSRGEKGRINANDESISVLHLMELFYDGNSPGLVGKPKLFFIGTSQGKREHEQCDRIPSTSAQPNPPDISPRTCNDGRLLQCEDRTDIVRELVPSGADFIVSYACLPGTAAYRDSKEGGFYVQALCRHLNQDLEIDIALRNVSQEVRGLLNTYDKKGGIHTRQDPFHIIMPPHKLLYLGSASNAIYKYYYIQKRLLNRQAAFS